MNEPDDCTECDCTLTDEEKNHNRSCGIDNEDWLCYECEYLSDPT